jgi:hypothetical protein
MYIGHYGVGFGAKWWVRQTSLGTLFLAAQFVDLLWPTLVLLGWERARIDPGNTRVTPLDFVSYPISHSLGMVLLWAVLFAGLYWLVSKYVLGAVAVGVAVMSHWLLDAITHRPDLLLYPGGSYRAGLGLWNSPVGTLGVELALFALGVYLYLRSTRARDRIGMYGLWGMVGFLVITYLSSFFSPPPPSVRAVAWVGQAQWLLVFWGYWVDKHREARAPK